VANGGQMSVWVWVALIVVSSLFTLSLVVGLAIAAILGRISREVSELIDHEGWTSAPLMRTDESAEEVSVEHEVSSEHVAGRGSRR
jgi:hypothetical protein